nr:Chain B, Peroxisome proliferator-activated receptor gamma coactivator 1-beta [Homo sapiens]
LSLLQKLLLAT